MDILLLNFPEDPDFYRKKFLWWFPLNWDEDKVYDIDSNLEKVEKVIAEEQAKEFEYAPKPAICERLRISEDEYEKLLAENNAQLLEEQKLYKNAFVNAKRQKTAELNGICQYIKDYQSGNKDIWLDIAKGQVSGGLYTKTAVHIFHKLVDKFEDTNSMIHLGKYYASYEKDYVRAISYLEKAARLGNREAFPALKTISQYGEYESLATELGVLEEVKALNPYLKEYLDKERKKLHGKFEELFEGHEGENGYSYQVLVAEKNVYEISFVKLEGFDHKIAFYLNENTGVYRLNYNRKQNVYANSYAELLKKRDLFFNNQLKLYKIPVFRAKIALFSDKMLYAYRATKNLRSSASCEVGSKTFAEFAADRLCSDYDWYVNHDFDVYEEDVARLEYAKVVDDNRKKKLDIQVKSAELVISIEEILGELFEVTYKGNGCKGMFTIPIQLDKKAYEDAFNKIYAEYESSKDAKKKPAPVKPVKEKKAKSLIPYARPVTMRCAVCGMQSKFKKRTPILVRDKSYLDFSNYYMEYDNFTQDNYQCPNCGYIGQFIDRQTNVTMEWLKSEEFKEPSWVKEPVVKMYYLSYLCIMQGEKINVSYYADVALDKATKVCEIVGDNVAAKHLREMRIDLYEKKPKKDQAELLIIAELKRQNGCFDETIASLKDWKAYSDYLESIRKTIIKLAQVHDSKPYLISDVVKD